MLTVGPVGRSVAHELDARLPATPTGSKIKGVWRNGSASDSRSEGWEFESLCPQFLSCTFCSSKQRTETLLHNGHCTSPYPTPLRTHTVLCHSRKIVCVRERKSKPAFVRRWIHVKSSACGNDEENAGFAFRSRTQTISRESNVFLRPQVASNSSFSSDLRDLRPATDRTVSTFPFEENAGFAFCSRTQTISRESNVFF